MPKQSIGHVSGNNHRAVENLRPTWAEIDLDALLFNIRLIQKTIGSAMLFPVVKADAYGHGIVHICKALERRGFDYICLALLEEAIELRRAGIKIPALILGPLERSQITEAYHYGCTPAAYRSDILDEIEKTASRLKRKLPFHLKIDTGMGRLGFFHDQINKISAQLKRNRYSYAEGIFSNFSSADEPAKPATERQMKNFLRCIADLAKSGIRIKIHHLANSAGLLNFHDSHMEAVRPGLLIYGINPPSSPAKLNVKPILSLRSRIISLKEFCRNSPIGYGGRFKTKRKSMIAVLPIGYDDGFLRALSPGSEVLLNGRRAPIIGAVSMDLITIDVTGIKNVKIGDIATIIGKDGKEEMSCVELAQRARTIPYEFLCRIGRRVPRIYFQDGKMVAMTSLLNR